MTMKLSIEELKTISKKPLESELSLQIILDFYKNLLIGEIFEFNLDYSSQPVVKLRFEDNNLCHLLGFQHIFANEPNAAAYTGTLGF